MTSDESKPLKETQQNKKEFYKKPLFWIIILLSITLIAILAFLAFYLFNQSKNKQAVLKGWNNTVQSANKLSDLESKIQDQQTFDAYDAELKKIRDSLNTDKENSEKLKMTGDDVRRYQAFIDNYKNYIDSGIVAADKIKDFEQTEFDKLKDKSIIARNFSDELKNNINYLKEQMPVVAFQVQDALLKSNKAILENELTSKTRQLAQSAASAKDSAGNQKVESSANGFLNAYLNGNAPLMRQYMTEGFQKEYDYNQLTPSARSYVYPASFRIITNLKIDDTKYKVQANVLFRNTDGSGQYTVGQELNFIYDSNSLKWLINSIRESNSF